MSCKTITYRLSDVFRKMLTCALRVRAQDKDLKMELKNKYCIENISS